VKRYIKKAVSLCLVLSVILSSGGMLSVDAARFNPFPDHEPSYDISSPFLDENGLFQVDYNTVDGSSYKNYLKEHEKEERPDAYYEISAKDYSLIGEGVVVDVQEYEGVKNALLIKTGKGIIEWEVEIEEAGLYNFEYHAAFPGDSIYQLFFVNYLINGELPFNEAKGAKLRPPLFDEEEVGTVKDSKGNQIKPQLVTYKGWNRFLINEYYNSQAADPILYYLKKGINTISFDMDGQMMYLDKLVISNKKELLSYEEYSSQNEKAGYKKTDSEKIEILAQNAGKRADALVGASFDRTSAALNPPSGTRITLNTYGGEIWKSIGQFAEWSFKVEEAGLYQLAIKYKQNLRRGFFVNRKITIDGETPFKELEVVQFKYDPKWQSMVLGGEDPYWIYLEEGEHIIGMDVVLGDYVNVTSVVQEALDEMNDLYLRIIMITGLTPDPARDYFLEDLMPDMSEKLNETADKLTNQITYRINGFNDINEVVDDVASKLREVAEDKNFENAMSQKAEELIEIADKMTKDMGDKDYNYRIKNKNIDFNSISKMFKNISKQLRDLSEEKSLNEQFPDIAEVIGGTADELSDYINDIIQNLSGGLGDIIMIVENTATQLRKFAEDPEDMKNRTVAFKNTHASLAGFNAELYRQSLELDVIQFISEDTEPPKTSAGFFNELFFGAKMFFASFLKFERSDENKSNESIRAWIGGATGISSGRDMLLIYKRFIDQEFTPKSGIDVTIEYLLNMNLIQAIMAGKAPDVVLGYDNGELLNLAYRGAVLELSELDGFNELASEFHPSSLAAGYYKGGVYMIPTSQDFSMMYYRLDILKKLNLEVPQTWDEFYAAVPVIQRANMDIGVPPILMAGSVSPKTYNGQQALFSMFLLQNDGAFYKEGLSKSAFDEQTSVNAFIKAADLYTKYAFPTTTDSTVAVSKFRSGETPIFISTINFYPWIEGGAPELAGLWSFSPIPGTLKEDGTIDRSEGSDVSGAFVLADTDKKEESWEFIKWFTQADTAADFALEFEYTLGDVGRQRPANIEAMKRLPWTREQREKILAQWDHVKGIPETPGNYQVGIELQLAFVASITDKKNPYIELKKAFQNINKELERKQAEFDF